MNLTINNLSKEQMDRLREYSDLSLLNSEVITENNKYVYKNAKVVFKNETWKRMSRELDDIFYEGNYTVENTLSSKN